MPGLDLYFTAFGHLHTCRQAGMGMLPIGWNVIQEYCIAYDLDPLQTEAMHHHIRVMDSRYLEHMSKQK